jgi:hypothetical protein
MDKKVNSIFCIFFTMRQGEEDDKERKGKEKKKV